MVSEVVQLVIPPVKLLIGHKIGPEPLYNGPERTGLEDMDMRGEGLGAV